MIACAVNHCCMLEELSQCAGSRHEIPVVREPRSKRRHLPVEPHANAYTESKIYLVLLGWHMGLYDLFQEVNSYTNKIICLGEAIFITGVKSLQFSSFLNIPITITFACIASS